MPQSGLPQSGLPQSGLPRSGLMVSEVQTLPGVPAAGVIADAVAAVVAPIVDEHLQVDDGPLLVAASLREQLAGLAASRPQFSARGTNRAELTMRWIDVAGTGITLTGHLRTYAAPGPDRVGDLVDGIAVASRVTAAPFAFVDRFEGGFRNRVDAHMARYQHDKQGAARVFGLFRGFSGVPWRTVLGPASVAFFGDGPLRSLPPDLARELSPGYWLLSPCDQPQDWTPTQYCEGERRIIEALGPDRFYDPATESLPTVAPPLPELSAVAATVRRRNAAGQWEWHPVTASS